MCRPVPRQRRRRRRRRQRRRLSMRTRPIGSASTTCASGGSPSTNGRRKASARRCGSSARSPRCACVRTIRARPASRRSWTARWPALSSMRRRRFARSACASCSIRAPTSTARAAAFDAPQRARARPGDRRARVRARHRRARGRRRRDRVRGRARRSSAASASGRCSPTPSECIGHPRTEVGRLLRALACRLRASSLFREVIVPDDNADHYNHFHLEAYPDGFTRARAMLARKATVSDD